jgi:hypothetical protein
VVDRYWAHAPDRDTPVEETAEAMGELVTAGAVRRLGASNFPTWLVERARGHAIRAGLEPFSALQLPGPRAVGLQPAGPGCLRPGRPALPGGLRPPRDDPAPGRAP